MAIFCNPHSPLIKTVLGAAALAALGLASARPTQAQGTIQNSDGSFQVGVDQNGNLYNPNDTIGFQRTSDGYDPIAPGTPQEYYSVGANGIGDYVDPQDSGTLGVVSSSDSFGTNSAQVSTLFDNGLQVNQGYSFVAANVLAINTTVTNVSGASLDALFERGVDWDIAPTAFNEYVFTPGIDFTSAPIVESSYTGFENPDPYVAFTDAGPSFVNGTFGPGDLGGAFKLDLGTLDAGTGVNFTIYEAISQPGQSHTSLTNQVAALGSLYSITGYSSDDPSTNSALLGVGAVTPSPEPSQTAVFALGTVGMAGLALKARRRRAA